MFTTIVFLAAMTVALTPDGNPNRDLAETLLSRVQSGVRPVKNPQDLIEIHVQSALYQIVDLEQRNNLATISAYFDMSWLDANIYWNPEDYNGTYDTYLPSKSVWKPELFLYHSVQGSTPLVLQESAVQLHFTGKVRIFVPFTARALCPVNIKYFPFDVQTCRFQFGSWSYKSQDVQYKIDSNVVYLGDFYDNQEWLLVNASLRPGLSQYNTDHHDETYSMVTMELRLQRQSFYYIFNLVIPTTLVSLVSVIGIHAPASSSGNRTTKFRLGIMTLLSMGVMLLMVVDEMPKFALASIPGQRGSFSSVPLLGLYYISLIAAVSSATIINLIFVKLEQYAFKHKSRESIPFIIRWVDFTLPLSWLKRKSENGNIINASVAQPDSVTNNHVLPDTTTKAIRELCSTESALSTEHNGTEQGGVPFAHKILVSLETRFTQVEGLLKDQMKQKKTFYDKYNIPEHWNRVIDRLENFSLFIFLSIIFISLLGLHAPEYWY